MFPEREKCIVKLNIKIIAIFLASMVLSSAGLAQTNYHLPGNTNFVGKPYSWSLGCLPTNTAGYIVDGSNGQTGTTASNLIVVHEGSTLFTPGNGAPFVMRNCQWTLNGGTLKIKTMDLYDSEVIINSGSVSGNTGTPKIRIYSGSTVNFNGGSLAFSGGYIQVNSELIVNAGVFNLDYIYGSGIITINGGTNTFNQGVGYSAGNDCNDIRFYGGTTWASRFIFASSDAKATFGGTNAGTATFNDWGSDLYADGWPAGSNDHQDDRNINIDFLSNTLVTLTMTAPRALDFTDENPNVYNPVYTSNAWAEALWETDRLKFHGRTKTDLGGSPDYDWVNATNWNGLGGYYRWDFDGSTLALLYEPPASGTVILID
ncbi:hypothetical protein BVX97_05670 [bacterium E08(2017)]|nr:hypothetical protein BVX97_05670 [bacterium E08(2017)]